MTLKVGLIIELIAMAVYGLVLLLIPSAFVSFIGGNPVEAIWVRWPGGVLLALALGLYLVLKSPARQGVFVIVAALGALLVGLALLFSWVMGEYSAQVVHVAIPTILNLVVAVLVFLGWRSSRELLNWV